MSAVDWLAWLAAMVSVNVMLSAFTCIAMTRQPRLRARVDMLHRRCIRISACETPGANGTVRRMARIARGEE